MTGIKKSKIRKICVLTDHRAIRQNIRREHSRPSFIGTTTGEMLLHWRDAFDPPVLFYPRRDLFQEIAGQAFLNQILA